MSQPIVPRDELIYTSATALAAAIRAKHVSSAEVVDAYLQRIEAVNPHLNALVQVAADVARRQAHEADAALARGEMNGPLHGVPFTAKDVCETAGLISAAGLTERAHYVPDKDAVVVARMKAAGAILLGKTNCPPGGSGGVTDNPVYGRTSNPYDTSRMPGGSSGGEAAAIAGGASPLGIGSDSGDSLRVPAHFCGIATLKPTSGRVPSTGTLNHHGGLSDYRTQIGPLARYVSDLALAFPILAGEDGCDASVIPMPLGALESVRLKGLRLAVYTDDGEVLPTPDIIASVRAAARTLADVGLSIDEARPACLSDARPITERYWAKSRLSGAAIEHLFLDWDRFRSAMLAFVAKYDVILCPADARPVPRHGEQTIGLFNYTLPFSLTGWPCVVVRAGTSPEGLPIGVQIVARPWREEVALVVAQHLETALHGWQRPPL
jgi:amidase